MKSKKDNSKLNFNKKNIIELNSKSIDAVNGGGITTTRTLSNITTIIDFSKNTLCTSDAK